MRNTHGRIVSPPSSFSMPDGVVPDSSAANPSRPLEAVPPTASSALMLAQLASLGRWVAGSWTWRVVEPD